jgi:hypothetical protein
VKTMERPPIEAERKGTTPEPVRFEKVILLKADNPSQVAAKGVLLATDDSLEFQGAGGELPMPKVREVRYAGDAWAGRYVLVQYGETPVMEAKFRDMSRGGIHSKVTTRELAAKLQSVLSMTPLSAEQHAEIEQVQQSVTKIQGRKHMLWGAGLAIIGFIVTMVTYSNASDSSGGTYLIWWGPMLFGVILFIQGLVEYNRHQH